MDKVKTFIYDNDIRIKKVFLEKSLSDIFSVQNFSENSKELFIKSAMFSVALSDDIKDDEGMIYVSTKDPKSHSAVTALCETDGRLRGCEDEFIPSSFEETVITVGRRLEVRGEYQSSVLGDDFEKAVEEFFSSSRQTKAKTYYCDEFFIMAEFFPGHDVNFQDDLKKPSDGEIFEKIDKAIDLAKEEKDLKFLSEKEISFGCTCNEEKIKEALTGEEGLSFPLDVRCHFCGKTYVIDNI